jgi:hypothetical protein
VIARSLFGVVPAKAGSQNPVSAQENARVFRG